MKLIFCLDKGKGMMFFGKRQSQDKVLRQYILDNIQDSKLWMTPYSAEIFEEQQSVVIDDNYMNNAADNDYCFVEDGEYSTDNVDEIILCHWNRKYPGDKFFDIDLKKEGFKKESSTDIVGSSHDKITIERYLKEE